MKVKLKNSVVQNKLLTLKLLKLNNFATNLNAIKFNLKHLILIIYKYKLNHKQILILNKLNNTFFNKLHFIKFLLVYWNKALLKNYRLFLKHHLIITFGEQAQFNFKQKNDFVWIPSIFFNHNLKSNKIFKRYKKTIVYNFLLLLLNINEFKKTKN